MKILVTGASGFTGQHFVEHLLANTDWDIYTVQRFRPISFSDARIHHVYHDFLAEFPERILNQIGPMDYIVHMGAEVHGIRSLEDPELFIRANALGTFNILEVARKLNPGHFIYVSSADVLGSTIGPPLTEDAPLRPSTPYAAGKAAGETLTACYKHSFGVPISIVRTMNLFGPHQDSSKFVPLVIKKILNGQTITAHVDGHGKSGSRCWLSVEYFIAGLVSVLNKSPDIYHIVGPEKSNLEVIEQLTFALHIPAKIHTEIGGKGHDSRYVIKDTKLMGLYKTDITESLTSTANWYKTNV